MPSNVSNAIGAQKQFSGSPQGVYEKRVIQPNFNSDTATATRGVGLQLAQSLGVLGEAIGTLGVQQEKDKEKIGIAKYERILAGTSQEDLRKRTAIEIANQSGDFQAAENPYTMLGIEKARGEAYAAKARIAYETDVIQKEGRAKTVGEEVDRLDKFMQTDYQKALDNTTNLEAFQKGYWADHKGSQQSVAESTLKALSKEADAIKTGTATAKYGRLAASSHQMSDEDFLKEAQDTINSYTMQDTTGDLTAKIKLAQGFLMDIAKGSGSSEKIKLILDRMEVGYSVAEGRQIRAGEVINAEDILRTAEITTDHLNTTREMNEAAALRDMSIPEQDMYFEQLSQKDLPWYKLMAKYRPAAREHRESQDHKKAIDGNNQWALQKAKENIPKLLDAQARAIDAGMPTDALGNQTAHSLESTPKLKYRHTNADGTQTIKEYTVNREVAKAYIENRFAQIDADTTLDEAQKTREKIKNLAYPWAKDYVETQKMLIGNALDSLTPDKLKRDSDGSMVLPEQLGTAMRMYQVEPEKTKGLLDEENTKLLSALTVLANSEGSLTAAAERFVRARDNLKDPLFRKRVDGELPAKMQNYTMRDFMNMDGTIVKVDTSMSNNAYVYSEVYNLATYLYATDGLTMDRAIAAAKQQVASHSYVWKDTVIPRNIFNALPVENKAALGEETLQALFDAYSTETGAEPQHVFTTFNPTRGTLTFSSGRKREQTYTIPQIINEGVYLLNLKKAQAPKGRNITLEEAQASRPENQELLDWEIRGEY